MICRHWSLSRPIKESGYFEKRLEEQASGRREVFIAVLDGINVLPDFRRRGVATALVLHCEEAAKEKGCEMIGISVGLYRVTARRSAYMPSLVTCRTAMV